MGEEVIDEAWKPSARTENAGLAAALAAALAADTPEARDYLNRQGRLTELQIGQLEQSEHFEFAHLRFRHFSDIGKLGLQIAGGLVILLAVAGLGTMVWNAAQSRGMVVEAFSVPPDLAQNGMSGSVLANRLIDRFGQLQSSGLAINQGSASYRIDSADAVRVEIPETGISVGELDRYLRQWLGREAHVSGDLVHDAKGYSLTVRYGDQPGATMTGGDLSLLLAQAAEHLMADTVPYHYIDYLARQHRVADAMALLPTLASNGTPHDQARGLAAWAAFYARQGDNWDAANKAYEGLRLEPHNPVLSAWAGSAEGQLFHEEASYTQMTGVPSHLTGDAAADMSPRVVAMVPLLMSIYREEYLGNFNQALAEWAQLHAMTVGAGYDPALHANDAVLSHDLALGRKIYSAIPAADIQNPHDSDAALPNLLIAAYAGDWELAARRGDATDAFVKSHPALAWARLNYLPAWAYAKAKSGDLAGAQALIAASPLDCDSCLRARARIAALKGDWGASAYWFRLVSARSPHIPFADTDWGETLLHKGDWDGAIAKFQSAHAKGPHYADPLEMWGEALMAENRSDLALTKFSEAAEDAPNWGRLHLKWGEALVYTGKKDEARAQFARAAALDLTANEKSELARQH
jgi:tetratricopeptide (TPR) repeat protein